MDSRTKNTGGLVFPRPLSVSQGVAGNQQILAGEQDGITLRDWFAGLALQGICASGPGSQWSNEMLAQEAYQLADTMLVQRESDK